MIGIDMTFIRKTEINKGFFSEGISIYCEQILRGIEKVGQVNLFVLLVFKDQEKTIKHLFPNYVIRVIDSLFVKVKSFAPRQIQRRLFAALITLSRKVFRPWHKWF